MIEVFGYIGAEDSNGIDYWVGQRADKNDVERNEMKKVFNFYKPLERCNYSNVM